MMQPVRKAPVGGGVWIALAILAGVILGIWSGRPSIGLVAGIGLGLALAVAVALWDHRRRS